MIEPLYLALSSRLAGSRFKWLGIALYPIPYIYGYNYSQNTINLITIITVIWIAVFKAAGHADGFKDYVRDNALSRLAAPIGSRLGIDRNSQAYDALFWAIKGGLIPLITLNPALIATSAIGYPTAYWLGFNHLHRRFGLVNTAWGELLAGLFAGMGFLFHS